MKSKQIKDEVIKGKDEIIRGLYKIFDKLEQRIATLEKVLQSHAKCIGEIRASEIELSPDLRKKVVKRLAEFHVSK